MNAHTERPTRLADGKTYCACGQPWPCPHAVPDDPASATLAAIRAIEQAATEGPWEAHSHAAGPSYTSRVFDIWHDEQDAYIAQDCLTEADATFIAAARTWMPPLLAAVEAVLKRHESRVPVRILAEYGSDEAERYRYCSTCSGHPAWPCPEVRAITAALSGDAP